MKHKILRLLILLFLYNYYSYAQSTDTVKNPVVDYLNSFESDSLLQNSSQHNICKVTTDFNSDGIKDVAVSASYLNGAKVSNWAIYLGVGNESYKFFSVLWFNNYAIKIDSVANGISNIYVYNKTGEGVGDIIEYSLSSISGIKKISQKTIHPKTFPINEDYEYYISIFTQSELIESCKSVLDLIENKSK